MKSLAMFIIISTLCIQTIINNRRLENEYKAVTEYDSINITNIDNSKFTSSSPDEIALYLKGFTYIIDNITIIKTGDTKNIENSYLYGINSALYINTCKDMNITNSNITINGEGAIGIYSYASSTITYQNSFQSGYITSSSNKEYQIGIFSTGGFIYSNYTIITMNCNNCHALVANKKESYNMQIDYATIYTYGINSTTFYIYNQGYMYFRNLISYSNSQIAIIKSDSNQLNMYESTLTANATGSKLYNGLDYTGIFINGDKNKNEIENDTISITYTDFNINSDCAPFMTITNA